ncbi:MAG: hypothetical protein RIE56_13335, partial [Amphiplicatus sp.]
VANRTGLAPGKTPLAVEHGLEKITPEQYLSHAHHWLILHGRYVCKARTPECPACTVVDLCLYKHKTPAEKPAKNKSAKKPSRLLASTPKLKPAKRKRASRKGTAA